MVVLDVGLLDPGGFEVRRRLRAQPGPAAQLPVIFLTARNDEVDRVLGLELGADDYMTKPFSPRELVARVRARLRRVAPVVAAPAQMRAGRNTGRSRSTAKAGVSASAAMRWT